MSLRNCKRWRKRLNVNMYDLGISKASDLVQEVVHAEVHWVAWDSIHDLLGWLYENSWRLRVFPVHLQQPGLHSKPAMQTMKTESGFSTLHSLTSRKNYIICTLYRKKR